MYRNLQIDVNIHYFPSTFLPFSQEEKEISHPTRPPLHNSLIQRLQIPINQKSGSSDLLGLMGRTSLNDNNDNSLTSDGIRLFKTEFPGKIGTDF